jgi:hypothetical protein
MQLPEALKFIKLPNPILVKQLRITLPAAQVLLGKFIKQ